MTDSPTPQSSEPAELRHSVDKQIEFAIDRHVVDGKEINTTINDATDTIMQLFETELARQTTAARVDEWERIAWSDDISDEVKDLLDPVWKKRLDDLRSSLSSEGEMG